MRIAIDIDDCITNTSEVDFELCYEYNKKLHPKDNKNYINNYHNAPTIFGFTKQQDDEFYILERKLCVEQDLIKPKVFAGKIIDKLLSDGHEIILVTGRSDFYWGTATLYTKQWLEKYNIHYTKLVTNMTNKGGFCKNNNVDVLIDDSLKYIKQCNDLNVNTITFNNNYSKKYDSPELQNYSHPLNIYSSCWFEVYDRVQEVEAMIKNMFLQQKQA